MIIVPDASVILKWVLEKEEEPSHAQASRLQEVLLADKVASRRTSYVGCRGAVNRRPA